MCSPPQVKVDNHATRADFSELFYTHRKMKERRFMKFVHKLRLMNEMMSGGDLSLRLRRMQRDCFFPVTQISNFIHIALHGRIIASDGIMHGARFSAYVICGACMCNLISQVTGLLRSFTISNLLKLLSIFVSFFFSIISRIGHI